MTTQRALTHHINRYLTSRRAAGTYNEKSVREVRWRLASLDRSFGNRSLDRLTERAIRSWLETITHLSPSSKGAYMSSVAQFCRWLCRQGLIAADPTLEVERASIPLGEPRALSIDQVADTIAACSSPRDRLICYLAVYLCLRRAEVAGLRWEHYDERGGRLLVVDAKGGKQRSVAVPDEMAKFLSADPRRRPTGPIIRSELDPNAAILPGTVGAIVSTAMYRAGVKQQAWDGVSMHSLRHTGLSDVLDECGNVRVVQALAGHSHLTSTERYLRRANLDQMRQAMQGRNYHRDEAA